jgi:hypothetical protein
LLLVQSVSALRSSRADDIELCFGDDESGVAPPPKINLVAASSDSVPLSREPHSSTGISGFGISGDTGAIDKGSLFSTYWYHVWVLMVRFAKSWVRTPIMAVAEAVQYVILSLFLGLLYLRSPLALPNAPFDRMGAMFVVLTMLSLTPSYTVLVMWDHERQLLRRETSTNMYKRYAGVLLLVYNQHRALLCFMHLPKLTHRTCSCANLHRCLSITAQPPSTARVAASPAAASRSHTPPLSTKHAAAGVLFSWLRPLSQSQWSLSKSASLRP